MHRVAFNQDTGFVPNLTAIPNESNAYYSYPFIRSSTLADLRDYRALSAGVGNLATISMTGSWLRGNDIYSGSVAATANGIKLSESANNFITTEFTRSLPDDSAEKSELCTSAWASTLTYWKNVPLGTSTNCQPSTLKWYADYTKWDTNLYANGGGKYDNQWSITNGQYGASITENGQYLQYQTGATIDGKIDPTTLKWKQIVMKLITFGTGNGNPVKRYVADFWNALRIYINQSWYAICQTPTGAITCAEVTQNTPDFLPTITINIPSSLAPTQMIFGNYYKPTDVYSHLALPIWTTIQSIQIQ